MKENRAAIGKIISGMLVMIYIVNYFVDLNDAFMNWLSIWIMIALFISLFFQKFKRKKKHKCQIITLPDLYFKSKKRKLRVMPQVTQNFAKLPQRRRSG